MSLTHEVISTLSPTEREEFQRFLAFRAPRLREDVPKAAKLLCEDARLGKEELFSALFGKRKKYADSTVRYILTDINRMLYEYLAFKRMAESGPQRQTLLLEELETRGCTRAFSRQLNATLRELDEEGGIGPDALRLRSDALALRAQHELRQGQRSTAHFGEGSAALDRYFVARKLQMSAEMLNLHHILSTDADDPFLDTLLAEADAGRFSDTPYITLYREVIRTLRDPDDSGAFQRLRTMAAEHSHRLPQTERHDLYQHILNYCIRRINAGQLAFQRELFDTYREALDCEALLTDGVLSQWDFKNIVTIGLRLREAVFVEGFIHGYADRLPATHRANAVAYNTANLCFHRREYRQALAQLRHVDLDDVFYRLDARSILLKTYFEMDDHDALFYHASAFRTFLARNRTISDRQRKVYQNLIRFTLSLARCGTERHRIRALQKRVADTPNVADLAWLEARIAEALA
jgi:hypothetical protein